MSSYQVTQADYDALGIPGGPGHHSEEDTAPVGNSLLQTRVVGGTEYIGPDGSRTKSHAAVTLDDFSGSGQGLLATARTQGGFPTSHPTPEDLIMVEGTPVTLEVAEMMGLVRRNGLGDYQDVSASMPQETPVSAEEQEHAEFLANAEAFASQADEDWIGEINQQMGRAVPSVVSNVIVNGVDNMQGINDLAHNLGTDPDTLREVVRDAYDLFKGQVDKLVKQSGISDPEAFYAWARESALSELHSAMNQHVYSRTTKGYRGLIQKYAVAQLRES